MYVGKKINQGQAYDDCDKNSNYHIPQPLRSTPRVPARPQPKLALITKTSIVLTINFLFAVVNANCFF